MYRFFCMATALLCFQFITCSSMAAETKEENDFTGHTTILEDVLVVEKKIVTPAVQAGETVYTGEKITSKGMEIQGAKAATTVTGALGLVPGINVESADSNGLGAEMNSMRIRGVRGNFGSLTVEGIPNYGGNPIGPRDYIYDMENFESVSVYKGAVPGNLGTGVGSRGGAIEIKPAWAKEIPGLKFQQWLGSNKYLRSFLHCDSGTIFDTDTALSASGSYSNADKWRGPGDLGPRKNVNLNLVSSYIKKLDIKFWFNHNDLEQHLYKPLTFEETLDINKNFRNDYNGELLGSPGTDKDYFDYNRGRYRNNDLFLYMKFKPIDNLFVNIKPYYSREDTEILQGVSSAGGMVMKRNRDIERTGFIFEIATDSEILKTVAGYHFEKYDMDISTQKNAIQESGLAYRGYGMYAASGAGYINSPYFKIAGNFGKLSWQTGLKYFNFKEPASAGYKSGAGPDYELVRAEDLDRDTTTYDVWLPSAGAAWDITDSFQAYCGYSRNFIRPYAYIPLINTYNANRAKFQAQGIGLQDLFDGYDIEKSDTVDIGLRNYSGWFDLVSTIFYSRHRNLLTKIIDSQTGVAFQQNVGKASGYGMELQLNLYPVKNLTIFTNPTYSILEYDEKIDGYSSTKGNQVVDTPKWMVKSGMIYTLENFEFTPIVRFIGKRYGDAEHMEEIDASTVVDLRMSYKINNLLKSKEVKIALELNNIFDSKYVAVINAFDDSRAGDTTYYQGAPFSAILSLSALF